MWKLWQAELKKLKITPTHEAIYRKHKKPTVSTSLLENHDKPMAGQQSYGIECLSCVILATNIFSKEYQAINIFIKLFFQTYDNVYNKWVDCVTLFSERAIALDSMIL